MSRKKRELNPSRNLKILGYDYKLEIVTNDDRIINMGEIDYHDQVIRLNGGISDQEAASTIIHEILEALNYHLHLKMGHKLIMPLEATLYQVLTDNNINLQPLLRAAGWKIKRK